MVSDTTAYHDQMSFEVVQIQLAKSDYNAAVPTKRRERRLGSEEIIFGFSGLAVHKVNQLRVSGKEICQLAGRHNQGLERRQVKRISVPSSPANLEVSLAPSLCLEPISLQALIRRTLPSGSISRNCGGDQRCTQRQAPSFPNVLV